MMTARQMPSPVLSDLLAPVRRNAPLLVVYGLLMVLFMVGAVSSERFLTERNLLNLLRQTAFLGVLALGQMMVILTAGIDLSVGSLVKLCVMVAAILMDGNSANIAKAVFLTLSLGAFVGFLHAFVITQFNVTPFIVTLGSFSILRGIALLISTRPIGRAAPDFLLLYDKKFLGVFVFVIFFFVLLVLLHFVLKTTLFGRYIYGVGGNQEVARLSGIPVNRVKFGVYILCSTLAAVTGLLWLSRMGIGDPVVGDGLELQVITAVILGGTSLFGGRGSVWGTLGGVLLLSLTSNLLVMLKVDRFYQELAQGVIIIIAVALYKQQQAR